MCEKIKNPPRSAVASSVSVFHGGIYFTANGGVYLSICHNRGVCLSVRNGYHAVTFSEVSRIKKTRTFFTSSDFYYMSATRTCVVYGVAGAAPLLAQIADHRAAAVDHEPVAGVQAKAVVLLRKQYSFGAVAENIFVALPV